MFDAAGLPHAESLERIPRSLKALALAEHARSTGAFEPLHRALFRAHWVDGRDIGADDVLLSIGADAGLDGDEARAALESPELVRVVERETNRALEYGASGVPAWLVDDAALIPGAQPHELFERVLERLGHAPLGQRP